MQLEVHKSRSRGMATAPAKNIFMTMFMMWMSGSSVQIFSIMITFYTAWGAISAILSVNKMFEKFQELGVDVLQDKLIFIAIQIAIFGVALYKGNSLGILPTTTSDFAFRYPILEPLEIGTL
eukprot:c16428_g1_i1.p1 GENE.c16428_g1_i1~~c16428_g1_i1.p1  ORF type:complete len:133 (+),score=23.31 c16428_g1_i1:34-399(+)